MRVLAIFGKFLISVGVGILVFVAWELWGTGLYTERQQDRLLDEWNRLPSLRSDAGSHLRYNGPPDDFDPGPGDPVFRLKIPSIGVDHMVVEGVGVEELKLGPGHYPQCRPGFAKPLCTPFEEMWPGERGRVIVSGHRTTYGAPFWDLQKLSDGDRVITETKWGRFVYRVTKREIVPPDTRSITVQRDAAEIVFTTCNPRFSAAQRLVVFAKMTKAA